MRRISVAQAKRRCLPGSSGPSESPGDGAVAPGSSWSRRSTRSASCSASSRSLPVRRPRRDGALILAIMRFGFGVPIRGNLVFLFGMSLIYLFALLALGLFVSTRTKTQAEAQQMAQMFVLPSIFLSGYIFPAEGLPLVLRSLGRLLPATHMISIMRGVVLRDGGPARSGDTRLPGRVRPAPAISMGKAAAPPAAASTRAAPRATSSSRCRATTASTCTI